jgi:hypothetical protein
MDLDWEKLVKRYVWHDERTPHFTRVAHLTRRQAHYELFGYALFMGVLFGVISIASLDSVGVSLYAFSVCCAAIMLGTTRHAWAALWCALAPLSTLAYFALYGFHPSLAIADKVLLVALALAALLYSRRLVAVARALPHLP